MLIKLLTISVFKNMDRDAVLQQNLFQAKTVIGMIPLFQNNFLIFTTQV